MKKVLTTVFLIFAGVAITKAQPFPEIFAGTWCDSTSGIYEHWEKAGHQHLEGYSYEIKNGEKVISEYIDLAMKNNKMIYTVSVKNQNNEKPVSFVLSVTDSIYTFVNHAHDFPTYIHYSIISNDFIKATVGNANRSFALNYHRID